ncbi:conserved hypothetical protein [Theileria equi strain WA]|uniref:Uncharacterized protein n=1 Tax=Theileria equi strain WA TaxID=1537102 RepID=L1LFM4_THEEQ|nr:conserved hypothetical protein [Theileria equi strain WA]EKX74156.1 conserved hypothetical protein [Theileria equi strain WA]|eukprot:XP_004833608.1 conserved hypothetical protein [Theileria equi strain WA]
MPNNAGILLELVSLDLNLLERSLTDLLIALGCDSTLCSEFSAEKLKDGRFYETFSRRSRNERIYSYFRCFKNLDLQVDNFCRLLHVHFERGIALLYRCGFTTFTRKVFLLAYVEIVYDFYHGILKQTTQYSIHDCLYLYRFFVGMDYKLNSLNLQNVYIRDEIYDLILHTLWYALKDAWWMYVYADEIKYLFPFLSHMRVQEGREIEIRDLEHVLHNLQFVVTALNIQDNSVDFNLYGSISCGSDIENCSVYDPGAFNPHDISDLHMAYGESTLDISMNKRDVYGNIHTDCNIKKVMLDESANINDLAGVDNGVPFGANTFDLEDTSAVNDEENGMQNGLTTEQGPRNPTASSSVTSTLDVKLLDESISNLQMYIKNMNEIGSLEFPREHVFSHIEMDMADSSSIDTEEEDPVDADGENEKRSDSLPMNFSLSSENVKTSVESTDSFYKDTLWPNLICKSLVGSIYVFLFESYLRVQHESLNRNFSSSSTYIYQMCTKLENLRTLWSIIKQVNSKWTENSGTRFLFPTISRLTLLHNNIMRAISAEASRPTINYLKGLHFMDDSQLYREILYNKEFLIGPDGPLALHIKILPTRYKLQICMQVFGPIIMEYASRPVNEESAIFDSLALWDSIVSVVDINGNPGLIEDENIQMLAYYLEEIKFSADVKLDNLVRRMNKCVSMDTRNDAIDEYFSINDLNYRVQDRVSDRKSMDSLSCNAKCKSLDDSNSVDNLRAEPLLHKDTSTPKLMLNLGDNVIRSGSFYTSKSGRSYITSRPNSGLSLEQDDTQRTSHVEDMLIEYIYDILSDFVIYPERKTHLLYSNVWINGARRKKILLFGSLLLLFRENSLLQPVGFINCNSITSILSPETIVQIHPKIELLENMPKGVYASESTSREGSVCDPGDRTSHCIGEVLHADSYTPSNVCWGWRMRLELSDICVTKLSGEDSQTEFVDFEFMNPEHRKIWYKRVKSAVKDAQCIKDICCNKETISWPYHTLFFDSI